MGKSTRSKRESNIEACRIVCMLLVVAHHCVVHGGALGMESCTNKYIAWIIAPGGKICFDAFLAISAWFLVDKEFRAERFFRTWGMVFFYSVLMSVVSVYMGVVFTWRNWFSVLFPITGNSHGFAASYLAFYLLVPFLAIVSKNITKRQAQWLVILLFYFQVISQLIGTVGGYFQPISSELLLFVLCYFIALYLKRYPLKVTSSRLFMANTLIWAWFGVFALQCWNIATGGQNVLCSILLRLCWDESSVLYLIGGYALFFLFYHMQMPKINIINIIAGTTFGILLLHDHNFFRSVLWNNIFRVPEWWYSKYFVLRIIACVVIIFIFGGVIDLLRQKVIERPIFSTKLIKNLSQRLDNLVNNKVEDKKTERIS